MRCLVFPYEYADGPANMALDEAMLDAVANDPSCAQLRTYGWTVPTLSLGYFQNRTEAEADPRWRGVPVVRRATGGGALWHHEELTYALVIPRGHPLARESRALYRAVHDVMAGLIRAFGLDASRRGDEAAPRIGEARPFLCFTGHDSEDIVLRGAKVVGSAQRRRAGVVLQHGALLLARSPLTPELPGVSDLAALPGGIDFWRDEFEHRLPEALGMQPTRTPVPPAVRNHAKALEETVYRQETWTARR